jgi:hypothetical protein
MNSRTERLEKAIEYAGIQSLILYATQGESADAFLFHLGRLNLIAARYAEMI